MGSRVQRGETASGPLVFWQDSDADLPKCVANDEGEDDCSLTTSDTKTRSLKPGTVCQIESRLIQINAGCTDLLIQSAALGIGDGAGRVLRLDLVIDERIEQELFSHVLEEVLLSPALEHGRRPRCRVGPTDS